MPDSQITEGVVLSTLNATATLGVSGFGGVAFQIQGTFNGTLTFEASLGSEWQEMRVTASDNSSAVTSTTDPGIYIGSAVGFTAVRVRMSIRNSGAAYVLIRADVASPGGAGGGGGSGTDVNLVSVGGDAIQLGQALMADSLPVVIASDQDPIPITGSITASNNAAGPVGDPIPADASSTAYEGPSGALETFKCESFDYDTSGATQPQTVIGIATPSSGGPLPVPGGSGTATGALRVELPTNGTGVIATVGTVTTVSTVTSVTSATVVQGTATNLKTQAENYQGGTAVSGSNPLQVTLANTGANTTAVKVDGSAVTQPVSGTVTANLSTPTTIFNGKKTVTTAGTRVTLASSQAVVSVTIKALAANTGVIYVGNSSVASTNGFQLAAGESVSMDIANLSTVNLDSAVNGEGVTYVAVA